MHDAKIYLDNNATTQLDPRVLKVMMEELQGPPANPSSIHWFGKRAKNLLNQAREEAALFLKAKPEEITFTSGGTESISLMLQGIHPKGHIITTKIEHSAVYETLKTLSVTYVPVGPWGAPLKAAIEEAIRPDTVAIVLSLANNETGVKLDLPSIAHLAQSKGIPLLIDAVAYIGKEPLPSLQGVSSLALSAHKFHGPKGAGLLYHHRSFPITSLLKGGPQEKNRRAGTENLAAILGLKEALRILATEQSMITQHLLHLRSHFETELQAKIPGICINGEGPRIANTSNISFPSIDGETLLMRLDLANIAASHGSACSAGALEPSRVLTEMGLDRKRVRNSIRFSFSKMNQIDEIDRVIKIIN
jgi:cysteine desulfurase